MTSAPPPHPSTDHVPPEPRSGFTLGNFISFRYMITPVLVQGIYILVAVIITIIGLIAMFSVAGGAGPLGGLAIIIIGNLVWRVYMEIVMLFFRINEGIQRVEQNTRR